MEQPRPAADPATTPDPASTHPLDAFSAPQHAWRPASDQPPASAPDERATELLPPDQGDRIPGDPDDSPPSDSDQGWTPASIEPADEDLDLLADSNRRPSRLTIALVVGILVAVGFGAGALVQKHYGGTTTTATAGRTGGTGGTGFNRQFAGGGAGGYGGFGGGGAGTGAAGSGSAAAADTPAVVGQVVKVSGTTVTVKNFAGKLITVKVPAGTTVSLSTTLSLTGLKAGTSVSVVGKTGADGSVTASAVTARK